MNVCCFHNVFIGLKSGTKLHLARCFSHQKMLQHSVFVLPCGTQCLLATQQNNQTNVVCTLIPLSLTLFVCGLQVYCVPPGDQVAKGRVFWCDRPYLGVERHPRQPAGYFQRVQIIYTGARTQYPGDTHSSLSPPPAILSNSSHLLILVVFPFVASSTLPKQPSGVTQ